MGVALIAGPLIHFLPAAVVPSTLRPLDHYVGTEGSVVGAAFGLGLIWASRDPRGNLFWVHLALLYGVLVIAGEVAAKLTQGRDLQLAPLVYGAAVTGLVLALYPQRARPQAPAAPPAEEPAASKSEV